MHPTTFWLRKFSRLTHVAAFGIALSTAGCGRLYMADIANDTLDPLNLADTEPSIAVNPSNTYEIAIVTFSENWTTTRGSPVW